MAANCYPDGLTIEVVTALQWEVNDELRKKGYPVQPAVRVSRGSLLPGKQAPEWWALSPKLTTRRRGRG